MPTDGMTVTRSRNALLGGERFYLDGTIECMECMFIGRRDGLLENTCLYFCFHFCLNASFDVYISTVSKNLCVHGYV